MSVVKGLTVLSLEHAVAAPSPAANWPTWEPG